MHCRVGTAVVTRSSRHSFAHVRAAEARGKVDPVMDNHDRTTERVGSGVSDDSLVGECLAGKRWAQRELWFRFAPMVYALLRRTLSSKHDYEDLV